MIMSKNEQNVLADHQLDELVGGDLDIMKFEDFRAAQMEKYRKDAEEGGYALDLRACAIQIDKDYDSYLVNLPY
jgi:hypothetical protein